MKTFHFHSPEKNSPVEKQDFPVRIHGDLNYLYMQLVNCHTMQVPFLALDPSLKLYSFMWIRSSSEKVAFFA